MKFSERYGYLKPSDVIIREEITIEIQNAICSCFDELSYLLSTNNGYTYLEWYLWCDFLNKRRADFGYVRQHQIVATNFIEDTKNPWFKKLDIIEVTIEYLNTKYPKADYVEKFILMLNEKFERLNFGYRIVDGMILEVTTQQEIESIEKALNENIIHNGPLVIIEIQ